MHSISGCSHICITHNRAGQTVGFCIQTDHVWGIVLRALKDKTDAAAGGKTQNPPKDGDESEAPIPKARILKVRLNQLDSAIAALL
jgi:hypothetical protein